MGGGTRDGRHVVRRGGLVQYGAALAKRIQVHVMAVSREEYVYCCLCPHIGPQQGHQDHLWGQPCERGADAGMARFAGQSYFSTRLLGSEIWSQSLQTWANEHAQ